MTIYDCSQPHVTLAAKDRNIIAATFTSFMQRNIGIEYEYCRFLIKHK